MVQRVLLGDLGNDDYGLVVSRPGFDVLDPNTVGARLAFDSRLNNPPKVFMAIEVNNEDSVGPRRTTHLFGRTFAQVPPMIWFTRNAVATTGTPIDFISRFTFANGFRIVDYRSDFQQGNFVISASTTHVITEQPDGNHDIIVLVLDVE